MLRHTVKNVICCLNFLRIEENLTTGGGGYVRGSDRQTTTPYTLISERESIGNFVDRFISHPFCSSRPHSVKNVSSFVSVLNFF